MRLTLPCVVKSTLAIFIILIILYQIAIFYTNKNTTNLRHLVAFDNFVILIKSATSLWSSEIGIFPETGPYDRVLRQINFSLEFHTIAASFPQEYHIRSKTIYVSTSHNHYLFQSQEIERALISRSENCPFLPCTITRNPSAKSTADAIFQPVFGLDDDYRERESKYVLNKKKKEPIWILYTMEPPYKTSFQPHSFAEMRRIWTATYRLDSDLPTPYGIWKYYNESVRQLPQKINYADGKRELVAVFMTNCQSENGREIYLRRLAKKIPIHIYGACGNGKYNCTRGNTECFLQVARRYKFIIAFENSGCRGYVTEKVFFNALRHNTVPIVMGAPAEDYKLLLPENSYIFANNFSTAFDLAQYLKYLNNHDVEYNKYFMWKGTGQFYLWTDHFFCRLCSMLFYNDYYPRSTFPLNINRWWRFYGKAGLRLPVCIKRDQVWRNSSRFVY